MTLATWVVVLDLDDTLYPERSYQRSGIAAVEQLLSECFEQPLQGRLLAAHEAGIDDLWAWACRELGLPAEVATSMLWAYRLHRPQIQLDPAVEATLKRLESAGATMAVLSDGRSVSQRLKLAGLGLAALPAFISEEHGAAKPDPGRYQTIERRWPQHRYVYVADNPAKDFLAPNRLGWLSVGLRAGFATVHDQSRVVPAGHQPHHWIASLGELPELLAQSPSQAAAPMPS